jgi:tetratricopeptide (TPR) repeat protein
LKKDLLEKEEFFSSLDLSTKEAIERKVLLLRGGEEFEKQESRIIKQRERYEEALRHYNASLREHENAPDKAKEEREALNRTWKDLEALKTSLRRRFGIILKPDIDEARARFIQACEAFQRKESGLRETLRFGEELSESLEHAKTLIAETLSSSLKKEKAFLDFSSALHDFKEMLHSFLSSSLTADENDLLHQVSEFIKREQSSGVALDTAFERLERAELVEEAGDALLAAEKAYKKSLEAHEKALSLYERELSEAREAHETLRSSYEEQWKKAREEMEKSPEEFRAVNETLLQEFSLPWQTEHEKVIETGGLHVIGSERFEARRIDNQLKGRSGRQGDPGSSKFYLSLEDDLLRIFGSERLMGIMGTMPEGENITHPLLTKMITNAQKKVEGRNFEIRKQLLDFDDVLNQQRKVIYGIRQDVLNKKNLQEILEEFAEGFLSKTEEEFLPEQVPEKWALDPLSLQIETVLRYKPDIPPAEEIRTPRDWKEDFKETLLQWISSQIEEQFRSFKEIFPEVVKIILLQAIDHRWKSHLRAIDDLREGIGLRAYAQKDVVVAYKQEAFMMFEEMLAAIQKEALSGVFHIKIEETLPVEQSSRTSAPISFLHQAPEHFSRSPQEEEGIPASSESRPDLSLPPPRIQPVRTGKKVGRNEPCPCGSGKKYKHCCGKG